MRKLATAEHTEFRVWVFTRTDLIKFVMVDIAFSSALYAGLKRINGHDAIAILGSSIGTHLYKYWRWRYGSRFRLWSGKPIEYLPWSLSLSIQQTGLNSPPLSNLK